ncbi:hypothetical protein AVEN_87832-2 [Araneus ventricosus]|uniref:Coiled-coil domain-containing protein 172 n=1 Tax=Araneus ventricosus TaxID=182803 RepID=A0A4Y2BB03_ARAVE|nr:hypothetical protein AVEN_87832-2 [Araneus ventricosus]
MTDNLEELFNNINQSEEESKVQQEYLEDLKSQIKTCENELKDAEQKCVYLQEATAKKVQRLCRREVLLKTLQIRHQLLLERIREMKIEKESLKKNLEEIKQKLATLRNEFCAEVTKFDEEYGFASKKGFTDIKNQTHDLGADKKDIPKSLQKHSNITVQELQKDMQDLEGIEALLFDVDFNYSQTG